MIFLLDTNAFGDLLRGQSQMTSLPGDSEVLTCVIVVGEILYGLEKMQPGKRRRQLVESYEKLFEVIPWVPVPDQAVSHYARTKGSCQRRGLSLDENDLWIAATAMALGATVISRDSDFSRVEGLSLVHPDHITDTDFGDYLFEVPDGRYNVNVESVELTSTNSSGEPMLKWALRIGGGTSVRVRMPSSPKATRSPGTRRDASSLVMIFIVLRLLFQNHLLLALKRFINTPPGFSATLF